MYREEVRQRKLAERDITTSKKKIVTKNTNKVKE